MSQAKVDQHKKEKYDRKHHKKRSNSGRYVAYIVVAVIVVAFLVYLGYSVAVSTGLYTPPTTTERTEWSDEEISSLRNTLIENGDPNVKYDTDEDAEEEASVSDETLEEDLEEDVEDDAVEAD